MFFNREFETASRDALRAVQDARLRELLTVLRDNPFYGRKFAVAGVDVEGVRSCEDLQRLPFTTKAELLDAQAASPPFGGLLNAPLSHYPFYHQTSGTTGRPLKWLDTEDSWNWWSECWQYVYNGAGIGAHDIIFFAFSFGPYVSHWAALEGARRLGALGISGAGLSSEQRLKMIQDNDCTVLVCTPTYAVRLAEIAAEQGIDIHNGTVRATIHAGEPGASLPNVRHRIESAWGARCYDHAGATEVGAWGFACAEDSSGLHLNEREFIFEVIEPGGTEPAAEGTRGELIITNLGRSGMPVLRYRTGDLVELSREVCACGRTFARIKGGVIGRADDMLIVRGVNVYPSAIDNLMRAAPEVVEYEVNIARVRGMDELTMKLETRAEVSFKRVADDLSGAFREAFNIAVAFEQAPPDSLPRYELKARRYKRVD